MEKIFEPLKIKNISIRNRICFPAVVCYAWNTPDGYVGNETIEHYRKIARGGAGLIIQEATCVDANGKLSEHQLGIWEDGQKEGLSRIVSAVHSEGCPIFIQIHHAGVSGLEGALDCPSAYTFIKDGKRKNGKEMSLEKIKKIQKKFVDAAVRAYQAGYDGVELHGCHQYLICEFMNRWVNHRKDDYGEQRELFVLEILKEIRRKVPEEFVVGIRLGGFEPRLEDGIRHAKTLDAAGIDFIDVSYGFSGEDRPKAPPEFRYQPCIYAAKEIKKEVRIPVFAVNGITDPKMAEDVILSTGVDMVDIARGMVVNYNWVEDAKSGKETGKCLHCKKCLWSEQPDSCVGRKVFLREKKKTLKPDFIDNL